MICDFCFEPVADEGGHIFWLSTIDSQLSTFFKASGVALGLCRDKTTRRYICFMLGA
jgi:hypothetical protein